MIIFGASGDLTKRKLIPALYNLESSGLLPEQFKIMGFARTDLTHETFRSELRDAVETFSKSKSSNFNCFSNKSLWEIFL